MLANDQDPLEPQAVESAYRALRENHPPSNHEQIAEVKLAGDLRQLAQSIQPDPDFAAELQTKLGQAHPKNTSRQVTMNTQSTKPNLLSSLAWAGLALILIIGSIWAIRNLLPVPPQPAQLSAATTSAAPERAPAQETQPGVAPAAETPASSAPPEATPQPQPTPDVVVYTSTLLPGVDILLDAPFPPSPPEVMLFEQIPMLAPFSAQDARLRAAELGIDGVVYSFAGEASQETIYVVSDGSQRVTFLNSLERFFLLTDYSQILQRPSLTDLPSQEQQIQIAESFLRAHGLLGDDYQVVASQVRPGTVTFYPLLNGAPVAYEYGGNWQIEVNLGKNQQVASVDYLKLDFAPQSLYPIISVEQAWQALLDGNPQGVIQTSYFMPPTPPSWQRQYQPGAVEMFGNVEILRAVDAGQAPLVTLNNFRLQGDLVSRISGAVATGTVIQVWGELQTGPDGVAFLQVAGWQPSPISPAYLAGKLERSADGVYLNSDDGQRLLLEDVPGDAPEQTPLYVQGVVLQGPPSQMEWNFIQQQGENMGGGGGGGGGFVPLNLSGQVFPTATALPYQAGDRLEGVRATIGANIIRRPNWNDLYSLMAAIEPSAQFPDGLYPKLEGDLPALAAYNGLPVRLWGSLETVDGFETVVLVERVEPVYPGLAYQAWIGNYEKVVLEGQNVIRFISADGAAYVLNSSINSEPDDFLSDASGGPILIEGLVYPDRMFAGLPVITDYSFRFENLPATLDGYQIESGQPIVLNERQPGTSRAMVDSIELVYITSDLRFLSLGAPAPTPFYAQPAWRFSGHMQDGTQFQFDIQALVDIYLQK